MNLDFWQNKRVFLSGHTGFKGSWLSLILGILKARTTGYALNPPTEPSLYNLAKIEQDIHSVIGDIRELKAVKAACNECNPEIIIHMAAQPLVRQSYRDPVETFSTNLMGTVNILEAARELKSLQAIVVITTDKCYGSEKTSGSYIETDPMGGNDPYSSSKACVELATTSYMRSFFSKTNVGIATARAGNVIGGGDWAVDRLVPDFFRAVSKRESLSIRSPNATRPWQHVLDPLHGYLMLAEQLSVNPRAFSEGWNFGPDNNDIKPVSIVADKLVSLWGGDAAWRHKENNDGLHEAPWLSLDTSKAKDRLKWSPLLTLDNTIQLTTNWYRAYYNGENIRDITVSQAKDYLARIQEHKK